MGVDKVYGIDEVKFKDDNDEDRMVPIDDEWEISDLHDNECDIRDKGVLIVFDLDKKAHVFREYNEKFVEMIKSHEYLFVQGFFGTVFYPGIGWTDDTSTMAKVLGNTKEYWEDMQALYGVKIE